MKHLPKLKEILAEQMCINTSQIKPESHLITDLGLDSLDTVETVMAIEEEWDLEIPDEDLEQVRTVKDAAELIERMACSATNLLNQPKYR